MKLNSFVNKQSVRKMFKKKVDTKAFTINKKHDDKIKRCGTILFTDTKIALHYLPWFAGKNVILELEDTKHFKELEIIIVHMHRGKIISNVQAIIDMVETYDIRIGEEFVKKHNDFKLKLRTTMIGNDLVYKLTDFNYDLDSLVIEGGDMDSHALTIYPRTAGQLDDVRVFYHGVEAKYIELKSDYIDLYHVEDVYIFINDLSKGGIISWIKNQIYYLRLSSKHYNIFLVYESLELLYDDQKFDCRDLNCDGICSLAQLNIDNLNGKLLIFTQLRIANECKSFFKDNHVIIQCHRNIHLISKDNMAILRSLGKLIECGYIELLEPQVNIDKIFSNNDLYREFKNYSPCSNYPISKRVVSKIKKVAYVGRLTDSDHAKNMDGLKRIINSCKEITFYVYGSGDVEGDFKKINNVEFKGFEYNKELIYKDIDLLILPSIQEAFPLVILEAASYGVKSLTYNNSNMVQKYITPEIGDVVELNNEKEFIERLRNFKQYEKYEVQQYFEKYYAIERQPSPRSYVIKREVDSVTPRGFIYFQQMDEEYVELRIFVLGYLKLVGEIMINSTFEYRLDQNKDYEYYSRISSVFPENFITIKIKKSEIRAYDFLEIICFGKKINLTLVRNAARAIEIDDVYTLTVGTDSVEITETCNENFKDIARKYEARKCTYLFQDRVFKADDNAEHLYRYTMKQGYKNIYYTINEDSSDFLRLLKEGFKLIKPNSKIHYLLLLKSEAIISSHLKKDILYQNLSNELLFLRTAKVVFLQHGIIFSRSDYKYFLNSLQNPCDLMIVTNRAEQCLVEAFSNYKNIKNTGLARYDNLHCGKNNMTNRILYFPTWNRNLNSVVFNETKYYKGIMSLLTCEELEGFLQKSGLILDFLLHPEVEKYGGDFKVNSENINMISNTDALFSEMVLSHRLLITDVSSLKFDFLFQEKAVISYVPYNVHSHNDIQDAEKLVYDARSPSEVCMILENLRKMNYKMDLEKQQLANTFFTFKDGDNCRRIFEEILQLNDK